MSLGERHVGDVRLADARAVCLGAWRRGWTRPAPRSVSNWADDVRRVPVEASTEPGKWRTSRNPMLREIMDCLSDQSPVREVAFRKSTQVGGTEIGINWLGYTIDHDPAAFLYVMPTRETAQDWVEQRFDPMVEIMPELLSKLGHPRRRDKNNKTFSKRFPGGRLFFAGANSSSGLSSKPVKKLVLDEVSKYPRNLDKQGSASVQAVRRTSTFHDRKILRISSPSVKGACEIDEEFHKGDQRHYYVPCPHCGEHQVLHEDQITDDGKYLCIANGCLIEEHHKAWMFEERNEARPDGAHWKPHNPDADPRIRSYYAWAAYTGIGLGYTWKEIADMRAEARNDPEKEITYVNTILGKAYASKRSEVKDSEVQRRAEAYPRGTVPRGGLVVTCGVDVQHDRFAVKVVAWGRGERAWIVDYEEIDGDPTRPDGYGELDRYLLRRWSKSNGITVPLSLVFIDGGNWTEEVAKFVRPRQLRRVFMCRGRSGPEERVLTRPKRTDVNAKGKTLARSVGVWGVGTNMAKTTLFGRMQHDGDDNVEVEDRMIRFPKGLPPEYFKQLTSEYFDLTLKRWVQKAGARNEVIDTLVYNYAAALHPLVRIDRMPEHEWAKLEAALEPAGDLFTPPMSEPTSEGDEEEERGTTQSAPQTPVTVLPPPVVVRRDSSPKPDLGSNEWGTRL